MTELDGRDRQDEIFDLDCMYCHRWFASFDRLATHMAARHGKPTPNDPGMVELPARRNTPRVPFPKRNRPMAKKEKVSRGRGGKLPKPVASENTDFNQFLKADDIGKLGATAKLLLTGEIRGPQDGTYGEEIICEVKLGRSVFDWSVRTDGVNYRMLYERFGANVATWKGKTVPVTVKMSRQKNLFIAIDRQ